MHSLPSVSSLPQVSSDGCAVCGDKVNGNRYGVPACLGCIVFFRRAIVRNSVFSCQRHGKCIIDHKSRCTCRHCRLEKCLSVGMNPNSIQRRDMMGPRKKRVKEEVESPESMPETQSPRPPSLPLSVSSYHHTDTLIVNLFRMQERQRLLHRSWFTARGPQSPDPSFIDGLSDLVSAMARIPSSDSSPPFPLKTLSPEEYHSVEMRRARKQDINVMMHLSIVDSIEWASHFPIFSVLPIELKREVLKEFAVAFMLVDQGFNTSRQNDPDMWILQHERVYMCTDYMKGLPKEDRTIPMAETKAKLHPDFVLDCINGVGTPMRELRTEPFECSILKSLLLFECHNVYPREARHEVASIRDRCLLALASYESAEHPSDGIERIGTLLLMIANIRNCIVSTYRQISVSDVFSLMSFDPLVSDVLLRKSQL